jgi:hypothetical protein
VGDPAGKPSHRLHLLGLPHLLLRFDAGRDVAPDPHDAGDGPVGAPQRRQGVEHVPRPVAGRKRPFVGDRLPRQRTQAGALVHGGCGGAENFPGRPAEKLPGEEPFPLQPAAEEIDASLLRIELENDVIYGLDQAPDMAVRLLGRGALGHLTRIRGPRRIPGGDVPGAGDDAARRRREPHREPAAHRSKERVELDLVLFDDRPERFGLKARPREPRNHVPHRFPEKLIPASPEEAEVLGGPGVDQGQAPVMVAGEVEIAEVVEEAGLAGGGRLDQQHAHPRRRWIDSQLQDAPGDRIAHRVVDRGTVRQRASERRGGRRMREGG